MGVELLALQATIDDYSIQITNLDEEINEAERKIKLGLYVNEFTYRSNIQKYNTLIEELRDTFENYVAKHTKYEGLLKATNEDIQQYNLLTAAK
jgi:peptidoglycan hydrolase CwlO-like protein